MKNFLLGSAATLGILRLAVGVTLGIWAAIGDAPWEEAVTAGLSPTRALDESAAPDAASSTTEPVSVDDCTVVRQLFTGETYMGKFSLLNVFPLPPGSRVHTDHAVLVVGEKLAEARACFPEPEVHRLVQYQAKLWLEGQPNLPVELRPQLVGPAVSWLAGETPVERTDALNEMAAIIRLYYVSHPSVQVVFAVPSGRSVVPGGSAGLGLRLLDLESDIRRLNLEIDILDLR